MHFGFEGYYLPLLTAIAVLVVASLILFRRRGQNRNKLDDVKGVDLSGKTAIVTGANTGIGFWTAQDLASRRCRVILACRSLQRGSEAREKIVAATGNADVHVSHLDLSDFSSVRTFAQQIEESETRLDILVNNAGILLNYKSGDALNRKDGLDATIAINHLGHYLLTRLLIGLLRSSTPSRIVNLGSRGQELVRGTFDFDGMLGKKKLSGFYSYQHSKLANMMFTRSLAQRLKDTGVTVYCLHPGAVATEIWRNLSPFFDFLVRVIFFFIMVEPKEGAETIIYTSVAPINNLETGKYYIDCNLAEDKVNPLADDLDLSQRLWEVSAELTGIPSEMDQ